MSQAPSTTPTRSGAPAVPASLRLGRIAYLNVFPMHWDLEVEPTLVGVPSDLNRALIAGDVDVACISSIEYARHADELVLLPSACIASRGPVGSIFAIGRGELEAARVIHVSRASATSAVLVQVLSQLRGGSPVIRTLDEPAGDVAARDGEMVVLIGDDALHARQDPALASSTFIDLGERWTAETGVPMVFAVWAARADVAERDPQALEALDAGLAASLDAFDADPDAVAAAATAYGLSVHATRTYFGQLRYRFDADERKGLLRFLRMAHEAGQLETVPSPRFVAVAAASGADVQVRSVDAARAVYVSQVGSPSALTTRPQDEQDGARALAMEDAAREVDIDQVLEQALRGERIADVQAVALLQSRRLNDIGTVANELRNRVADPDTVTFIVDRNINYTNICVTDCGFCAFYRRPDDTTEGYLQSSEEIIGRIRETIDLGGTAALLQGGHHPDLGIDYYTDLFRAVKSAHPAFHLHALSPPEIQHIARRSKMSVADVLIALRDAGLDSVPGGGGEILVDRVRRVIAPKKVKTSEWLSVMREAHRLGMSTTASMMYGHAELLAERVEHMRRIRELQDETRGFRAFISWPFQPGNTPLARLIADGAVPYADQLPLPPLPIDYLITQAVSRIYLDNVPNIQSSWVTQGLKIGQVALAYGANDLGSIMIEENVVSAAGTTYHATVEEFVTTIRAAGKHPVQRDTLYRTVRTFDD